MGWYLLSVLLTVYLVHFISYISVGIFDLNSLRNMSSTMADFLDSSSTAAPILLEALKNTTLDVTQVCLFNLYCNRKILKI